VKVIKDTSDDHDALYLVARVFTSFSFQLLDISFLLYSSRTPFGPTCIKDTSWKPIYGEKSDVD